MLGDHSIKFSASMPLIIIALRVSLGYSCGFQRELAVFWGSKSGAQKINKWYMNKMPGKLLFLYSINWKDTVSGWGTKKNKACLGKY